MSNIEIEKLSSNGEIMSKNSTEKSNNSSNQQPSVNTENDVVMSSQELSEWIESLEYIIQSGGTDRSQYLLKELLRHAEQRQAAPKFTAKTPYINTISKEKIHFSLLTLIFDAPSTLPSIINQLQVLIVEFG